MKNESSSSMTIVGLARNPSGSEAVAGESNVMEENSMSDQPNVPTSMAYASEKAPEQGRVESLTTLRVGVIDSRREVAYGDGLVVHTQIFNVDEGMTLVTDRQEPGDRGVIDAFSTQARAVGACRIEVFSAVALPQGAPESPGSSSAAGLEALEWLADHDVRVLIAPNAIEATAENIDFLERAVGMGLMVFTPAGNERDPAVSCRDLSTAITVATTSSHRAPPSDITPKVATFQADVSDGSSDDAGLATARVAAFAAHLVARDPRMPLSEVRDNLGSFAQDAPDSPSLAGTRPVVRLRAHLATYSDIAATVASNDLSSGPSSRDSEEGRLHRGADQGKPAAIVQDRRAISAQMMSQATAFDLR